MRAVALAGQARDLSVGYMKNLKVNESIEK
jgi:hypothetical protein